MRGVKIRPATYKVFEVKTGVTLTRGSYDWCCDWIFNNCTYDEELDTYVDADNEVVTIDRI